jgi:hypothetical protein
MMNKEEIVTDLNSMSELIAVARSGLSRNQLVEISDIQERIRGVVESITDLPPVDGVEVKPVLLELLSDFQEFSKEVEAKIGELQAAASSASNAEQAAET